MSTTPEYNTLISLTDELRLAVQPNLVSLSGSLMAKYLITPEKANQLRNQMHSEADRAANLVDIIRNKVLQNAQHYHTFVQVMESQGRKYYHDILNKLDEVYQQLKFNANSQQSASQAPGPASVSRSDIKQRYSHRIESDGGSAGITVNSGSRFSPHQSNSTVHASQLWCYLLKGGGFVLLVGVVSAVYYYRPGLECSKIESPRVLYQELKEIGQWEDLCLNLGVSTATMESLKHDSAQNTEKKRQCLKAFYQEDTEPGVQVCWETVVKAVSSYPISKRNLAKEIANKYGISTAILVDSDP